MTLINLNLQIALRLKAICKTDLSIPSSLPHQPDFRHSLPWPTTGLLVKSLPRDIQVVCFCKHCTVAVQMRYKGSLHLFLNVYIYLCLILSATSRTNRSKSFTWLAWAASNSTFPSPFSSSWSLTKTLEGKPHLPSPEVLLGSTPPGPLGVLLVLEHLVEHPGENMWNWA